MPLRPAECRVLIHRLFEGRINARELLEKAAPGRRELNLFSGARRQATETGAAPTTARGEKGPDKY